MVGDLVTTFSNWVRRSTNKIGVNARNSTSFKIINGKNSIKCFLKIITQNEIQKCN